MTALQLLAQWNRKFYSFQLNTYGNVCCGDGPHIKLSAAGREVEVYDFQLKNYDDIPSENILEEIILEALRQWHADTTIKNFQILYRLESGPAPSEHQHRYNDVYVANFHATNEEDAKKQLADAVNSHSGSKHSVIVMWEMTKDWKH